MDYEGVRRLAIGVIAFWVGQHTGQMPKLDGVVKRVSQKPRLKKKRVTLCKVTVWNIGVTWPVWMRTDYGQG